MKAKYSIIDKNRYNFDKFGFIISIISINIVITIQINAISQNSFS